MSTTLAPLKSAEHDLIGRAQLGDRDAFGELVRMHYQGAVNVVYRLCGDIHLAEDVAQETFLKVWDKLHTYKPVGSFRGWVYRIAANAALDILRKKREEVDMESVTLSSPSSGVEQTVIRGQQAKVVRQAVLSLPPASRAVLVLREYEGLTYQEIADSLEIPIGTVMSRLAYARGVLKKLLANQLEEA